MTMAPAAATGRRLEGTGEKEEARPGAKDLQVPVSPTTTGTDSSTTPDRKLHRDKENGTGTPELAQGAPCLRRSHTHSHLSSHGAVVEVDKAEL